VGVALPPRGLHQGWHCVIAQWAAGGHWQTYGAAPLDRIRSGPMKLPAHAAPDHTHCGRLGECEVAEASQQRASGAAGSSLLKHLLD
jgi:hypothetical protein